MKKPIYISRQKLQEMLKDPLFAAYAPIPLGSSNGRTSGGMYKGKFYLVKKGVE